MSVTVLAAQRVSDSALAHSMHTEQHNDVTFARGGGKLGAELRSDCRGGRRRGRRRLRIVVARELYRLLRRDRVGGEAVQALLRNHGHDFGMQSAVARTLPLRVRCEV